MQHSNTGERIWEEKFKFFKKYLLQRIDEISSAIDIYPYQDLTFHRNQRATLLAILNRIEGIEHDKTGPEDPGDTQLQVLDRKTEFMLEQSIMLEKRVTRVEEILVSMRRVLNEQREG
jgi:hypothetical protein